MSYVNKVHMKKHTAYITLFSYILIKITQCCAWVVIYTEVIASRKTCTFSDYEYVYVSTH